jgi:hypothetical protein
MTTSILSAGVLTSVLTGCESCPDAKKARKRNRNRQKNNDNFFRVIHGSGLFIEKYSIPAECGPGNVTCRQVFFRRINGTQKIFFIENQNVTIPVPGLKAPTLVGVFAFGSDASSLAGADRCKNLSAEGAGTFG